MKRKEASATAALQPGGEKSPHGCLKHHMGEEYDKAASLNGLFKSSHKCLDGVRHKDGPMEFTTACFSSCGKLRKDLLTGKYKVWPGTKVKISRPKPRVATAPWFKDRVWQRSMVDNGVYRDLTDGFLFTNMACQKGKGPDLAIRTIIQMLQELHRENPNGEIWGDHLDIRKYFPSTPQREIIEMDERKIRDKAFLPYLREIATSETDPRSAEEIAADPFGKRGTGLGSQINQLHQIALLNDLDHEVASKCPHYLRYNDDFLILSNDKEVIKETKALIEQRLMEKGLTPQDKGGIFKASDGFYFMRKRFIVKPSGKIIIRLHPKALKEERNALRGMKERMDAGEIDIDHVKRHYQSWVANASYAGDGPLREMDRFYTQLFRQRPEYKLKRRYLYGNRCDKQRKTPNIGERESEP